MNPNFKPEMITPKLLKACEEQVQKYFYGPMDEECEFCKAVGKTDGLLNCDECPLSGGDPDDLECIWDDTFILPSHREDATKEQLLARGKFLIKTLDEHGITIYDKEVK